MMNKVFVLFPTIVMSKGFVGMAWLGKLWCLNNNKYKGCHLEIKSKDLEPNSIGDMSMEEYLDKIAKENEF